MGRRGLISRGPQRRAQQVVRPQGHRRRGMPSAKQKTKIAPPKRTSNSARRTCDRPSDSQKPPHSGETDSSRQRFLTPCSPATARLLSRANLGHDKNRTGRRSPRRARQDRGVRLAARTRELALYRDGLVKPREATFVRGSHDCQRSCRWHLSFSSGQDQ